MTASNLGNIETTLVPNRTRVGGMARWIFLVPSYLFTLVAVFLAAFVIVLGSPLGSDEGASATSLTMVSIPSFAAIVISALVAPRRKRLVVVLFALLTVSLLSFPYESQSLDPEDWDVIPSIYKFVGAILGSLPAVTLVFYWAGRRQDKLAY